MFSIYRSADPSVSVIMATYNRAKFLVRSISSFINQTFKDCELIVVDDGSTDETFQIVNDYMKTYENIRYLKHTNRKLSLTRNAGIMAAIGKYIAFLDSDDEYKPDYLEKRVQFMEANKTIDMVEGGEIIIGDPFVKDKNDQSKKIPLSDCHIGTTFFGKREIFIDLGGFDKTIFYGEDAALWEKAEKVYSVNKVDYLCYVYYRDTPGSMTNSI